MAIQTGTSGPKPLGNRGEGEPRSRGILPFPEIEMDMHLDPDEMADDDVQWPPDRFRQRDEKLAIYRELWQGNLSSLVDRADRIPRRVTNLFRRIPKIHAALLGVSPIGIDDDSLRVSAERAGYEAVTNLMRSGMGWLWYDGEQVHCIDPAEAYPLHGGGLCWARRYTSHVAKAAEQDRIRIYSIGPDGTWSMWVRAWSGSGTAQTEQASARNASGPGIGNLGAVVEEPTADAASEGAYPMALPPLNGTWGTSEYDDLAGLVCALAEAHDLRAQILVRNITPLLTYRIANIDVLDAVSTEGGDDWSDVEEWGSSGKPELGEQFSDEEQYRRQVLRRLRLVGSMRLADGIEGLEYVIANIDLAPIEKEIEQIHEELRMLHALPSVLTATSGSLGGVSGESLKRQLLIPYATSSTMLGVILAALRQTLNLPNLEWPHPFDILDAESPSTTEEAPDGSDSGGEGSAGGDGNGEGPSGGVVGVT